ncbi:MAG: hypothetical protein K2L42_06115 [Clostridia bacterium]|nr:hypothetical protein [Clostridia bacterium]
MNKKLTAFLSEKGFGFDNTTFAGKLNGYQISGSCVGNVVNLKFYVNLTENDIPQVTDWLNTNKKPYTLNNISVNNLFFSCTVNAFLNSAQKAIELMIGATDFLSTFKTADCCPFCGESMADGSRLVGIGADKLFAHEVCFDKFANDVTAQESLENRAPNNYLKGTLGAVIGCLAGCAIWIIMYCFLELIGSLGAIVGSLLAAVLWDKFGGKNDKIKIIIIWATTIVLITAAMFASYLIDAQMIINEAIKEYGIDGVRTTNAFEALKIFYTENEELRNGIIMDTVISYIFLAAGNIYTTIRILQTQKLVSKTLIKY